MSSSCHGWPYAADCAALPEVLVHLERSTVATGNRLSPEGVLGYVVRVDDCATTSPWHTWLWGKIYYKARYTLAKSWIQRGRLCWISTKSTLSLWPRKHTGDKVDRISNKIDRDKLSNSRCCRFVAKTSNKVDRTCSKVDRIGNSRLCRQCVPGLRQSLVGKQRRRRWG